MVQIDNASIKKSIDKIKKEYSHLSDENLNTAISRALNHTASKGKTEANQNIRAKYNISTNTVNQSLTVRRASRRQLTAKITAIGAPLSWNNFQAKQIGDRATTSFDRKGRASSRLNRKSRTKAAKGVTATIKKGQTVNLPTAFIQVANGGITIFARAVPKGKSEGLEFTKERLPIAKITTTSIPMMFISNDVMTPTITKTDNILEDRIIHEINWLLSKM